MPNRMKSSIVKIALACGLSALATSIVRADSPLPGIPYATDGSGQLLRSGAGSCWRTGTWSVAAAEGATIGGRPAACLCEPELFRAELCAPPPPAKPPLQDALPASPATLPAPPPKAAAGDKTKVSAEVRFDYDKAILSADERSKLDELVSRLSAMRIEVILAVGHADRIGAATYNQRLSEKRAATIKEYLIGKGIPANRIYTEGKGSTQPIDRMSCDGHGKASRRNQRLVDCLQSDRRVEIEAIGTR